LIGDSVFYGPTAPDCAAKVEGLQLAGDTRLGKEAHEKKKEGVGDIGSQQ